MLTSHLGILCRVAREPLPAPAGTRPYVPPRWPCQTFYRCLPPESPPGFLNPPRAMLREPLTVTMQGRPVHAFALSRSPPLPPLPRPSLGLRPSCVAGFAFWLSPAFHSPQLPPSARPLLFLLQLLAGNPLTGGEVRHSGHAIDTSQDHPRVAFGIACSEGACDGRSCTFVHRAWATAIKGWRSARLTENTTALIHCCRIGTSLKPEGEPPPQETQSEASMTSTNYLPQLDRVSVPTPKTTRFSTRATPAVPLFPVENIPCQSRTAPPYHMRATQAVHLTPAENIP